MGALCVHYITCEVKIEIICQGHNSHFTGLTLIYIKIEGGTFHTSLSTFHFPLSTSLYVHCSLSSSCFIFHCKNISSLTPKRFTFPRKPDTKTFVHCSLSSFKSSCLVVEKAGTWDHKMRRTMTNNSMTYTVSPSLLPV